MTDPCHPVSVHVGIVGGTGPAGSALAARLASVGVDVVIGSRSAERAVDTCGAIRQRWPDLDLQLRGAENRHAAGAELVVVATPWDAAASTAASVGDALEGKVVVSMANALVKVGDEFQALVPARGSIAAALQAAVPGALVAAAFQHLPARSLGDLDVGLEADVLVCSDHPRAVEETCELVGKVPGLRPLDAGRLASASAVEAFTAVLLQINVRYRARAAVRLTGLEGR